MSSPNPSTEPVLLLQTKFYRPRVSPNALPRPHLIEHLNQGLSRKLTLITAPAGYGKTTIATQWLDQLQTQQPPKPHHQIAWLSLDESDTDLVLFVHYLIAAIQKCQPGSCPHTFAALHNPQPPSWLQLATLFVNDLIEQTAPLILALDDYHYVENETIHQFIDRLLHHLPPTLHLIIISRTEPPLSLPLLRARQQMNELRTADLSFTPTETERYLTQTTTHTPKTITALQERSEGWITGLYLTKLALSRSDNEQTFLNQLQASHTHITDYLISEVLAQQPPAIQTFLLYTSILRRFCLSLCTALLAEAASDQPMNNAQAFVHNSIDWLTQQNLFVITLDDNGSWYRYHHLLQLMLTHKLQQQASPETIRTLHHKASRWFAQEGFIDEALHHALIINDHPFAAELVEQNRINRLNQFDYHTLTRWLSLLPESKVHQHPHLLLLKCWLGISTYRLTSISLTDLTQQAEHLLNKSNLQESQQMIVRAEILAVKIAYYCWVYDFSQIISYYYQAMADLPQSYRFIRAYITQSMGIALQAHGKIKEAIQVIQTELQHDPQNTLPSIGLRGYLAVIYFIAGRPHEVIQIAEDTLKLLRSHPTRQAYMASVARRWLGTVYYYWNQLTTAQQHFQQADPANSSPYYNSQLLLAWSYDMSGQPEKADQVVAELHRWALPLNNDTIQNSLTSFNARRLYRQGKVEMALAMMRDVNVPTTVDNFFVEMPALTHAKILIAHHQESSWQTAQTLLEVLWTDATKQGNNIPGQVEILALKALLQQRQGFAPAALATLEQAIKLAKPIGFIRLFVDLGTSMAALLHQLLEKGIEPNYLGQILAAFPYEEPHVILMQQATQTRLIEPLTQRELDVLCLLAEEMPNKKIAQQLSISTLTVKRHTINIYKKLSVSNRREAASRARTLGILLYSDGG